MLRLRHVIWFHNLCPRAILASRAGHFLNAGTPWEQYGFLFIWPEVSFLHHFSTEPADVTKCIKQETGEKVAAASTWVTLAARWQVLFSRSTIQARIQKCLWGQSPPGMKELIDIQKVGSSLRTVTFPERNLVTKPRFLTTQPHLNDLTKAGKPTNCCCFCNARDMDLPFLQASAPFQQPLQEHVPLSSCGSTLVCLLLISLSFLIQTKEEEKLKLIPCLLEKQALSP